MLVRTRLKHHADRASAQLSVRWRRLALDAGGLLFTLIITLVSVTVAYHRPREVRVTADTIGGRIQRDGFYDPEVALGQATVFRWAQGNARLILPNPGGRTLLRVTLGGGPRGAVPVTIRVADTTTTLQVSEALRSYTIVLPPYVDDRLILQIQSSTVPEKGGRSFGVAVGDVLVQGGESGPHGVWLTLLLLSGGLYVLVLIASRRRIVASASVLLVQLGLLVWYIGGGWASGSFSTVFLLVSVGTYALALGVWIPSWAGGTTAQTPATRQQTRAFWQAHSKIPALLAFVALAGVISFVRIGTQLNAATFGLDSSWFLELGYKLRAGLVMGRDSYFTYGPLAQLLVGLGIWLQGGPSLLDGFTTGFWMFELAGILSFAGAVLFIPQVRGTGALFILGVCYLVGWLMNMRQGMAILSSVFLVYVLNHEHGRRRLSTVVGALWFAAQLLTAEMAIYTVAAGCGLLIGCALLASPAVQRLGLRRDLLASRIYMDVLAISLGTFLALNLGLELAFKLSAPGYQWFDYVRYTLAILTAYNYTMGLRWLFEIPASLVLLGVLVYCLVYIATQVRSASRPTFHLLIGLALAAVINMKSALVRSDGGHIAMASAVLIFLLAVIICLSNAKSVAHYSAIFLLALVFAVWPLSNASVIENVFNLGSGKSSLLSQWHAIRNIRVATNQVATADLRQVVDPSKQIVSFPYDNVLAIALDQPSLAPVLQTYSAHNLLLQQKYVRDVAAQQANVEIIYGLDSLSAVPFDGVQHNTRVPEIFRYIIEHFTLKSDTLLKNGYVVLTPRPQPKPLAAVPIAFAAKPDANGLTMTLPRATTCALLELDVRLNYSLAALFGRPRGMDLFVKNGAKVVARDQIVAVERGKAFATFVYLGTPGTFASVLGDTPASATHTAFDRLSLVYPDYSVFDVRANSVAVEGLRCAR